MNGSRPEPKDSKSPMGYFRRVAGKMSFNFSKKEEKKNRKGASSVQSTEIVTSAENRGVDTPREPVLPRLTSKRGSWGGISPSSSERRNKETAYTACSGDDERPLLTSFISPTFPTVESKKSENTSGPETSRFRRPFQLKPSASSEEPQCIYPKNSVITPSSEPVSISSRESSTEPCSQVFNFPRIPSYLRDIPDRVRSAFHNNENAQLGVTDQQFRKLVKEYCKLPAYFGLVLFRQVKRYRQLNKELVQGGKLPGDTLWDLQALESQKRKETDMQGDTIAIRDFLRFWTPELRDASRTEKFIALITPPTAQSLIAIESDRPKMQAPLITMDDIKPMVEALVDRHPDLSSLRKHILLKRRYVCFVLSSVLFPIGGICREAIRVGDLRRSTVVDAFFRCACCSVDKLSAFSVQSFLRLNEYFEQNADGSTESTKTIPLRKLSIGWNSQQLQRRIMLVLTRKTGTEATFEEFLWLSHAVGDRMSEGSLMFWFRVMDWDDDGYVSDEDLSVWYRAKQKLVGNCITSKMLSWKDSLTQTVDCFQPHLRLGDHFWLSNLEIRSSGLGNVLYDMFIDVKGQRKG
eukprot:gb/GECG01001002.1/.p1 GENE.gb/GECG01001002.1/~~gb/GECG01001002.1/.p1  ORF type:complete len:578 (+),score=51.88 gb/GECG01001002.1/:1-1734(+)